MTRRFVNGIQLWKFDNLFEREDVDHFVTDRNTDGVEFTLSLSSLPDKEVVRANRRRLAEALHIDPQNLFLPSQIHGTSILRVDSSTAKEDLRDVDALITNVPGAC